MTKVQLASSFGGGILLGTVRSWWQKPVTICGDQEQICSCQRLGLTACGDGASFWSHGMFWNYIVMMAAKPSEHTKNHQTVHFQRVGFALHTLRLNKK